MIFLIDELEITVGKNFFICRLCTDDGVRKKILHIALKTSADITKLKVLPKDMRRKTMESD